MFRPAHLPVRFRHAAVTAIQGPIPMIGAPFRRDAMQDQACLLPRYEDLTVSR